MRVERRQTAYVYRSSSCCRVCCTLARSRSAAAYKASCSRVLEGLDLDEKGKAVSSPSKNVEVDFSLEDYWPLVCISERQRSISTDRCSAKNKKPSF